MEEENKTYRGYTTERMCAHCHTIKLMNDFATSNTSKSEYKNFCKPCDAIRKRDYRLLDPEKHRHASKIKNLKTRESRLKTSRSDEGKRKSMKYTLKNRYNMTFEEYEKLEAEQENCCSICKIHRSNLNQNLSVDHCYNSKIIRGLLCGNCNRALGLFKDNIEVLETAVEYLKRYKQN